MPQHISDGEYISSREAAEVAGVSHRAWQTKRFRSSSGGASHPPYLSLGNETLYSINSLERFLRAQEVSRFKG